jgi:catechol 2,3-dioxygenase-like lactoylglutathione lyase family enzyme
MHPFTHLKRTLLAAAASAVVAAGTMMTTPLAHAQAPGIVGIDHVGINVPDLDQAVAFFHDMFGFEPVTRLGPFKTDANWRKTYHLHDDAGAITVVMLRAGDGSNIELFGYAPASGSKVQPYRDDIGATHLSLYTTDIDATKAYLAAKGLKFLSDVNSGGGDTDGERWVYFETPWGATIELNAYPNGKGYEQRHPAVKLWNAGSTVELTTAAFTPARLQAVAAQQLAIWNDTDTQARLAKMKALYRDNLAFFDHESTVNGLAQLNERVTKLQREHQGFRFTLQKVDNSNSVVRVAWNYGPAAAPRLIGGTDMLIMAGDKVRALSVFMDRVPAPKK